jgi:hypothetical protein
VNESPLGDDLSLQVVAATLRSGQEDLGAFLGQLAGRLGKALPGRVRLGRSWRGVRREVRSVEVDLANHRYLLRLGTDRLDASVATVVRDVVVRTERVGLDAWVESLSADLMRLAEESLATRLALERLIR